MWSVLKNSKINLPYDTAILLLGIYLKKMKTDVWKVWVQDKSANENGNSWFMKKKKTRRWSVPEAKKKVLSGEVYDQLGQILIG